MTLMPDFQRDLRDAADRGRHRRPRAGVLLVPVAATVVIVAAILLGGGPPAERDVRPDPATRPYLRGPLPGPPGDLFVGVVSGTDDRTAGPRLADRLARAGWKITPDVGDPLTTFRTTTVLHRRGEGPVARAIAERLGIRDVRIGSTPYGPLTTTGLIIVAGEDLALPERLASLGQVRLGGRLLKPLPAPNDVPGGARTVSVAVVSAFSETRRDVPVSVELDNHRDAPARYRGRVTLPPYGRQVVQLRLARVPRVGRGATITVRVLDAGATFTALWR